MDNTRGRGHVYIVPKTPNIRTYSHQPGNASEREARPAEPGEACDPFTADDGLSLYEGVDLENDCLGDETLGKEEVLWWHDSYVKYALIH
jgi:hypothetical protein